jgi:hypothetical protein
MYVLGCRFTVQVAECNPQVRRRCGKPSNTWKCGVTEIMQRKDLKDEKCFDAEL